MIKAMGNSCSGNAVEDSAFMNSKQIDAMLRAEARASVNCPEFKLLLLGPGESGKSTLLKQFRLIYHEQFSDSERKTFRTIIRGNVMSAIHTLLKQRQQRQIPFGSPPPVTDPAAAAATAAQAVVDVSKLEDAEKVVASIPTAVEDDFKFPPGAAEALRLLWNDGGIQQTYNLRSEYQLVSSCKYFLDKVESVVAANFVPSNQDILAARVMTTSITETNLRISGQKFRIFDVGGQRSERRKWAPYFDDVNCIIFVADIGSFDGVLIEDHTVNRVEEALTVFHTIATHPLFADTTILLFLNKIDILKEKLKTVQLKKFFPDFKGSNKFEDTCDYFESRFKSLYNAGRSGEKLLHIQFTWATDTKQMKNVLKIASEAMFRESLKIAGLT